MGKVVNIGIKNGRVGFLNSGDTSPKSSASAKKKEVDSQTSRFEMKKVADNALNRHKTTGPRTVLTVNNALDLLDEIMKDV